MKKGGFFFPGRIHRSDLRLALGAIYFRFKRRIKWILDRNIFACEKLTNDFPFSVIQHESPILRKLNGVDMALQQNKSKNLEIAAQCLSGLTVRPGEVFSFWKIIGKPTSRRGFLPGLQLKNGGFTAATGGGLCQMTNLIYWMTLHTPLTVIERWRHTFDVFPDSARTLPFGSGASCVYNYVDLQILNSTNSDFRLKIWLEKGFLKGEWQSSLPSPLKYIVYEAAHEFRCEPSGGYTRRNSIRRKTFHEGIEINDEAVTENIAWVMYNPLIPPVHQ